MMQLAAQSAGAAQWQPADYEAIFASSAPARHCLIAQQAERAIGFIVMRELEGVWELENLAVPAELRRQGIATLLLLEMLALAAARAAKIIFLEVRESNHAARALYEHNGFTLTGRRTSYYSQPLEDALIYRFTLSFPQPEKIVIEPR